MQKIKKFINIYFPPIAWGIFIFILSSQNSLPGFEQSPIDFFFKKSAHIFVYLVLYLLVKRSIDIKYNYKQTKKQILLPIFICLIYAISDELHQSMTPGRYPTVRDVGYDMLGVGTAFLRKYNFI
ncbi:VanZ family protein [Candidatus Woesebacteria bacterium]|nr:VanZ family protein [Candidatus Woesebacteria bacterium]